MVALEWFSAGDHSRASFLSRACRSGPLSLTAEGARMFANEFADGSWRPASEIGNRIRNGHCLPTGPLIRADSESALDDGRRRAFPHAACPRLVR